MTDKEKLEKALAHLKKIVDGDRVFDSDILADFPELAESEDERIRKAIRYAIGQSTHSDGTLINDILASEAIAYLEKQKEQKPSEKQNYSSLTDFERAIHRGFLCAGVVNVPVTTIKETAHECMAKIKPIEWGRWEEDAFRSIFTDIKTSRQITVNSLHGDAKVQEQEQMNKILDFLNRLKAQVKPVEWSDKDKNIFKLALDLIKHSDDCDGILDQELAVKWFAELPSRFVPQPKQEWSEEDEKMLSDVLESLRRYQLSMPNFQVELQMRWLKSLRPQPKRVWRRFLWHPTMRFDYTSIVKYDGSDEYEIVKAGNKPTREMNGVFIPIKEISTQPHWKPSEEQLRALNHFLDFHRPQYAASTHGWTAYEGLKSLYDQLLKLK